MMASYLISPCPTCGRTVEGMAAVASGMRLGLPPVFGGSRDEAAGVHSALQPCGHEIDGFWMSDDVIYWVLPGQLPTKRAELNANAAAQLVAMARELVQP